MVREQILETASRLFYANGYKATGINEIVAKSGVSKATLYANFQSKEELCLAYLGRIEERNLKSLHVLLTSLRKGQRRILGLFDFALRRYQTSGFHGCWCHKTFANIPNRNYRIKKEIREQKRRLLYLIEDEVRKNLGLQDITEVKSLSRRIYLLYEIAIVESDLLGADWPIREAKELARKVQAASHCGDRIVELRAFLPKVLDREPPSAAC